MAVSAKRKSYALKERNVTAEFSLDEAAEFAETTRSFSWMRKKLSCLSVEARTRGKAIYLVQFEWSWERR